MDSPLFPHIFLHQTVEQKNEEPWDKKEERLNVHLNLSIRDCVETDLLLLNLLIAKLTFTL